MPKYRYVGTVAKDVAIGDKRVPLGPGDFITMSAEQHDAAVEEGLQFMKADGKEGGDK